MTRWLINRKRRAFQVFFLLLLAVVGGMYLRSMPALSAQESTLENLRKFSEILDIIEKNYVEEVDMEKLIEGAVQGMMKSLDPHSTYLTAEMYRELQVDTKGEFGGLGIVISIKDEVLTVVSPIEDTPAFKAGIEAGDRIVKIDGEETAGISIMDAVSKLRGPKGTDVTISIMRDGFDRPKDYTITRDIIKIKSVRHRVLNDGVGYIRISSFQENTADDLKAALKELNSHNPPLWGLVLDLRNNPGGLLDQAITVSDLFLKSGVIVTTKGRSSAESGKIYRARDLGIEPNMPIIVLVNGGTASGSEILAGALRDNNRALLLGTQTFGKGVMQMIVPLRDGSALKLTTAKYYTPSGVCIQAMGLTPDFVVDYRRPEIQEEKKTQLREQDLKGHIESESPMPDALEPPYQTGEDFIIDNQLQHAIDLIKGWELFKAMEKV